MLRAIRSFLDFVYLVRRHILDVKALRLADEALGLFLMDREIFRETGVREELGFALPRQHSMLHYVYNIRRFGAPNGLCTSITESKHIAAVKDPYRLSNHNDAQEQMQTYNERMDKLSASRCDFKKRGMLKGYDKENDWVLTDAEPGV